MDASILKMLGGGGAGAAVPIAVMFMWFTPAEQFNRHVAEASRPFIFDTIERAAATDDPDYHASLCRTLEQAIAELCATAPDDAICLDRAMHLARAGCR